MRDDRPSEVELKLSAVNENLVEIASILQGIADTLERFKGLPRVIILPPGAQVSPHEWAAKLTRSDIEQLTAEGITVNAEPGTISLRTLVEAIKQMREEYTQGTGPNDERKKHREAVDSAGRVCHCQWCEDPFDDVDGLGPQEQP